MQRIWYYSIILKNGCGESPLCSRDETETNQGCEEFIFPRSGHLFPGILASCGHLSKWSGNSGSLASAPFTTVKLLCSLNSYKFLGTHDVDSREIASAIKRAGQDAIVTCSTAEGADKVSAGSGSGILPGCPARQHTVFDPKQYVARRRVIRR